MNANRVAIYCRLSVEDEDKTNLKEDSESILNQKLLLMDYAKKQDWDVYGVYSDDDYSGLDRDRPEFNRMIADAKCRKFDIILCKHQSRFTRDMTVAEEYLNGWFISWNIRFVSIVDNIDTTVKGNKKARQINGLLNEWYCEDISESIRAVFRKKMEDGQYIGSFAAYGYIKDPKDRHKLIIDEVAAETVKEIFNMYLQGYGCQQIAKTLTSKGVPTPTIQKRSMGLNYENPNSAKYSSTYGVWANNSIKRILSNRVYIGDLIQGREKKVHFKRKEVKVVPKDQWIIKENSHEPIIDETTFYKVQELMNTRRVIHKPKSGYKGMGQAFILSGKVKCLDCGSIMTRSAPARNGEHYLRCSLAYKTRARDSKCSAHTIKLEVLANTIEKRISSLMDEYMADGIEMRSLKNYFIEKIDLTTEIKKKEKELDIISEKEIDLSRMFTQAYSDMIKGVIKEEQYKLIEKTVDIDTEVLKVNRKRVEEHIEKLKQKYAMLKNVDEVFNSYVDFKSLTHEMVNDFIVNIEVGERNEYGEQRVVINWNF